MAPKKWPVYHHYKYKCKMTKHNVKTKFQTATPSYMQQ